MSNLYDFIDVNNLSKIVNVKKTLFKIQQKEKNTIKLNELKYYKCTVPSSGFRISSIPVIKEILF